MSLWLVILLTGVLTFGTRLSFILLIERLKLPGWFQRSLRYIPLAVLSAIILPELASRNSALDLSLRNPQFFAGALAVLVAWRTRNVLLTIIVGLASLLLFQAVLGMI
jgi:branched-subunit amino acid transport protein